MNRQQKHSDSRLLRFNVSREEDLLLKTKSLPSGMPPAMGAPLPAGKVKSHFPELGRQNHL